jgi:hypothetical protein
LHRRSVALDVAVVLPGIGGVDLRRGACSIRRRLARRDDWVRPVRALRSRRRLCAGSEAAVGGGRGCRRTGAAPSR